MLPLVVTVESKNGQKRRYAFADSPVRVGRSPFAELQLTEAFVSRWEGTLRFDANEVTYFHVSATNPTYIDGRVAGLHEEVPIDATTVLTLGELKLRFARESVNAADVRHKGKRQPIKADDETVAKTVWLDASRKIEPVVPEDAALESATSRPAYKPEPRPHEQPHARHDSAPPQARHDSAPPQARHDSAPPQARHDSAPPQARHDSAPQVRHAPPPISQQPPPVAQRPSDAPPQRPSDPYRPSAPEAQRPSRPVGSDSVRIAREVRVLPVKAILTPPHGNVAEPPVGGSRPAQGPRGGISDHVQALVRPPGGFVGGASHPSSPPPADSYGGRAVEPRPANPAGAPDVRAWDSSGSGSGPRLDPNDLDALHAEYRVGWEELSAALTRKLESTPGPARRQVAEQLQRRFPQIAQEADFRALLSRFNLETPPEPRAHAPSAGSPEIVEWLRNIAQGVLPAKFNIDPGMTLERVLALLEMLTQSFAEINDAQDNIRRHWLGRAPRASILRSDNGKVILAYMLNPSADWNERLGELESAISDVVMHELSLFKATLEGARGLVESLSPAALAKAEEIDLESLEEGGGGGRFLGRLLPRDTPEARLWKRFMTTYEGLMDGDRYQRTFLGRKFARTYLAAMGQRDGGSEEREKPERGGDK